MKISVIMAVFDPNPHFLNEQVESLMRQTHEDFQLFCVNADLKSQAQILNATLHLKQPVTVLTPDTPLNAIAAFEFGLQHALTEDAPADYYALCDQDDIWYRERLSTCLQELIDTNSSLVHSDARVIGPNGELIHSSIFKLENRLKRPNTRHLLYQNTVTGMTTLFTKKLLEQALPFPAQHGTHFFHDLWLALIASSKSELHFIQKPLVYYRQHSKNVVGAVQNRHPRVPLRAKIIQKAGQYGLIRYLAGCLQERGLRTKKIQNILAKDSLGLTEMLDVVWLFLRGNRSLAKHAFWVTVLIYARKFWSFRRTLIVGLQEAKNLFDQKLFNLSPGLPPPVNTSQSDVIHQPWWHFFDARMKADWVPDWTAASPTVSIFVPSLNPREVFAGIATAIDFGLGLANQGHHVRFIATDMPIASHQASLSFITSRDTATGCGDRVSLLCGVTETEIKFHEDDTFIATAWWTAHMISDLIGTNARSNEQFYYLIQDFEPGFYPWGTEYAHALASYDLNFVPVFNTRLLQDYFVEQKIIQRNQTAYAFRPSINIDRYAHQPRRAQEKPRIAFYGRPEVSRNMFELGIEALGRWVEANKLTRVDIELVSVGMQHAPIELPGGITMRSQGKLPWDDYPEFLSTLDMGLSLMCSPHPSHPPLEMAAAGAQVVTNTFATKSLDHLCPAIQSASPTVDALEAALTKAWSRRNMPRMSVEMSPLGEPLEHICDTIAAKIGRNGKPEVIAA